MKVPNIMANHEDNLQESYTLKQGWALLWFSLGILKNWFGFGINPFNF